MKTKLLLLIPCFLLLGHAAWADGSVNLAQDNSGNYWATFSNLSEAVVIPSNSGVVRVYTVGCRDTGAGADLVLYPLTSEVIGEKEGYFVPAATGVLIKASTTPVTYYTATGSSSVSFPVTNLLHAANGAITPETEHTYYKLSYGSMINEGNEPVYDLSTLGFHYGAEGGGSYTPSSGKAYLDLFLAAYSAPAHFVMEEMEEQTTTPTDLGNCSLQTTEETSKLLHGSTLLIRKDGVTYDIFGRTIKTEKR